MSSINNVVLLGRVGRDPEKRFTQGGQPVVNFSMATSETWKDRSGQKQERTSWHRVVVFGPSAEAVATYVSKGSQVAVEGRLNYDEWTDKSGQKRTTAVVKAERVTFLGPRKQREEREAGADDGDAASEEFQATDDDLPF